LTATVDVPPALARHILVPEAALWDVYLAAKSGTYIA